jgi:signal transduction histidine kinase/DNA-binding response OmpR family regulator
MKTLVFQDRTADGVLPQTLRAMGCLVTTCHDLAKAKDQYRVERFSLVVLDDPSDSGQALLAWIRSQPLSQDCFVLALVAREEIEKGERWLAAGANDILLTPWDAAQCRIRLAAVRQTLAGRQHGKEIQDLLNTRAQQQAAIAALGHCAVSEELPTVTDLVSRFIMHTMEVEFCRLLEWRGQENSLECVAGFGWRDGYVGSTSPAPAAASVTGCTLAGEDVVFESLVEDPRFREEDNCLREHGVESGISVAVKGKTEVLGSLGAFTARKRRFSEDELHFLQGLANVLGAAIDRKRSDTAWQEQQRQLEHLQRLEIVGQLAAGLAHDYNNVLTIIHGHVTMVLSHPSLPEKYAASLRAALAAVERAASLTRQLLTFSRKESIERKPLDLNSVVVSVTKLLDRILGSRIRLEFTPGLDLPAVEADAGMLEQVIINLAVNARDAMPDGGKLTVATRLAEVEPKRTTQHPEARGGRFIGLTVADSGCGMNEATLRRIFEPFFTTKPPGKGTGLGLATAYGIIKQHHGWIEVQSRVGAGTTFLIFLPTLDTQPVEKAAAKIPAGPGGQETILLVEDEPRLREVGRFLLEQLGYRVIEAASGMEALRAWASRTGEIQLLLTDLVLPDGLTGFDLAQRLLAERPDLKVLCTSGYDAEKVRRDLPAGCGFHFLQKPYRTEALARAIRQCLDSR